jgi:hypothetical protein
VRCSIKNLEHGSDLYSQCIHLKGFGHDLHAVFEMALIDDGILTTRIGLPGLYTSSVMPSACSKAAYALGYISNVFGPSQTCGEISSMMATPRDDSVAAAAFESPLRSCRYCGHRVKSAQLRPKVGIGRWVFSIAHCLADRRFIGPLEQGDALGILKLSRVG